MALRLPVMAAHPDESFNSIFIPHEAPQIVARLICVHAAAVHGILDWRSRFQAAA